eukprot:g42436.t1
MKAFTSPFMVEPLREARRPAAVSAFSFGAYGNCSEVVLLPLGAGSGKVILQVFRADDSRTEVILQVISSSSNKCFLLAFWACGSSSEVILPLFGASGSSRGTILLAFGAGGSDSGSKAPPANSQFQVYAATDPSILN